MRLLAALLLLSLSGCATAALAQAPAQVFRGRIGAQPVVVKLARAGDRLSGSYVYERVGQDIKLTGRIEPPGRVTLDEADAAGRPTGKFSGKLDDDPATTDAATIEGMWARPDGSRGVAFSLREQHLAFTQPRLQFISKTLAERRPAIKAIYPQLAGSTAAGAVAFNRAVEDLVTKLVRDIRQAASEPPERVALETDYNVLLAQDDLVSVEINEYMDYGGAHPNNSYDALTYDLRTGRAVAFAALFKPGAQYEAVLKRAALANLRAQERKLDAENGARAGGDESFFADGELPGEQHAWGLTPRGLIIYFDLPHVISVFDKVFIPWGELQGVLNPQGPAARFVPRGQRP